MLNIKNTKPTEASTITKNTKLCQILHKWVLKKTNFALFLNNSQLPLVASNNNQRSLTHLPSSLFSTNRLDSPLPVFTSATQWANSSLLPVSALPLLSRLTEGRKVPHKLITHIFVQCVETPFCNYYSELQMARSNSQSFVTDHTILLPPVFSEPDVLLSLTALTKTKFICTINPRKYLLSMQDSCPVLKNSVNRQGRIKRRRNYWAPSP